MGDSISTEKFESYHKLTTTALSIARDAPIEKPVMAAEIFEMVENYLSDARYFEQNDDLVRAFGAVNYAHGWLDCGARLKVYLVDDNHYFTEDGS